MEEIRSLIGEGKTVELTVKGYSMNPFMVNMKDKITLGPFTPDDIKTGTVALVLDTRGNYLIHRIIKIEENTVTLLGDGNIGQTETATKDNIIGIMYKVTKGKRTYTTDSFVWKTYSAIWKILTPVRRWPLALWRKLHPQAPLN